GVEVVLFAPVLSLNGHNLVSDHLTVAGERLGEAHFVGEGHNRDLILRFEIAERSDGRGANLIVERVDASGTIDEEDDREWEPLLTEMRDRLLDAILKDFELVLGQIADDASGLFLPGQDIYIHKLRSHLQGLRVRSGLSQDGDANQD